VHFDQSGKGKKEGRILSFDFDPGEISRGQFEPGRREGRSARALPAIRHYDAAGWREGRDPSRAFDTATYLSQNPDVAAAQINPLTLYLQVGASEGRIAFNDGVFA
jgi:hypothetical protein